MNMQSRWRPRIASLTLLSAAVALGGCASAESDAEATTSAESRQSAQPITRVISVETWIVEPTEFVDYIRITGEAEGFHDVTVSAEEGGTITSLPVSKGRRVSRGQVIATIDDRTLAAQVAEAKASAALAAEQWDRQRRLWEDDGMGTEIAYIQAKYQSEIAVARLASLQVRLDKTQIRAPVSGVFDENYVEVGEIALPGTPVARVVSVNRLKVSGGVPERFAPFVKRGNSTLITFDILPGREFEGTINFVGSSVDEGNRTFPIEIVMSNPDGVVKPRMVANVQLVREAQVGAIVVSQDVVRRTEDGYNVFVLADRDGNTIADARAVRLGSTYGNRVVIDEGLEAGETLITLGSQLVDNGSVVRVVNSSAQSDEPEG